jgi:hypothetical protein
MPCRKAGIAFLRAGTTVDSHEKKRQYDATNANWMRVSVAGFRKAFRIDFDEVFVNAEEKYHTRHSICVSVSLGQWWGYSAAYYEFWRHRGLQCFCNLLRILAHTSFPCSNRPNSIAQALLPCVTPPARRPAGLPIISAHLPPFLRIELKRTRCCGKVG